MQAYSNNFYKLILVKVLRGLEAQVALSKNISLHFLGWAGLGMFIVNWQYITAYLIHYISRDITFFFAWVMSYILMLFLPSLEIWIKAYGFGQPGWLTFSLGNGLRENENGGLWLARFEAEPYRRRAARGEWTERTCWVFPVQYPDLLNGIISKMGSLSFTLQPRCCPLASRRTEARTQHFSSEPNPMLYRMMYVPRTFSSSAQSLNAYGDRLIIAF